MKYPSLEKFDRQRLANIVKDIRSILWDPDHCVAYEGDWDWETVGSIAGVFQQAGIAAVEGHGDGCDGRCELADMEREAAIEDEGDRQRDQWREEDEAIL